MLKKKTIILSTTILLFCLSTQLSKAKVNMESDIINTRNDIYRQRDIIEKNEDTNRQNTITQIKKSRSERAKNKREINYDNKNNEKIDETINDTNCIQINTIKILLNGIKFNKLNKYIQKQYVNKCLNKNNLMSLRDTILNYFISKGYVTTVVYIDIDKINDGSITFNAVTGKINKVTINGKQKSYLKNKELNLNELNLLLDQFNKLRSNNATMSITPQTDKYNYSDIIINNKKLRRTSVGLDYNNEGNKYTGRDKYSVFLSQDDFLGTNNNLQIKYTTTDLTNNKDSYSNSLNINLLIPFIYYTFAINYNSSHYIHDISGKVINVINDQTKNNLTVSLNRVMYNSYKYKNDFTIEIEKTTQDIVDTTHLYIFDQHRILIFDGDFSDYIFKLYFNNIFTLNNKILTIKPIIYISKQDEIIGKLDMNYNSKITNLWFYNLQFSYQKIKKFVLENTANLISLDNNTIRGFKDSSISGQEGFYLNNNFYTNFLNNKLKFTIFLDYGQVKDKVPEKYGTMSSTGFILNYNRDHLDTYLMCGKGIYNKNFDGKKGKKENSIKFGISLKL